VPLRSKAVGGCCDVACLVSDVLTERRYRFFGAMVVMVSTEFCPAAGFRHRPGPVDIKTNIILFETHPEKSALINPRHLPNQPIFSRSHPCFFGLGAGAPFPFPPPGPFSH